MRLDHLLSREDASEELRFRAQNPWKTKHNQILVTEHGVTEIEDSVVSYHYSVVKGL